MIPTIHVFLTQTLHHVITLAVLRQVVSVVVQNKEISDLLGYFNILKPLEVKMIKYIVNRKITGAVTKYNLKFLKIYQIKVDHVYNVDQSEVLQLYVKAVKL